MLSFIIYLAAVGLGTGIQACDAIQSGKKRNPEKNSVSEKKSGKSFSSGTSDCIGYTPVLDSPDFWHTFGGY